MSPPPSNDEAPLSSEMEASGAVVSATTGAVVGELEGELVNPLEEDIRNIRNIEVVFDKQVNEQLKGKTLVQLKCAKACSSTQGEASSDLVSKQVGECIQEIEQGGAQRRVIFEEPLELQFKRIFGIEIPSKPLSVEEFYKFIAPVLKLMKQDDVTFFYEHYGGVIPQEYKSKYYF